MALKVVVKSLTEVPEALREHYTQVGDEYVLDADDKDYKSKIGEFRDNNIDLKRKLEDAAKTEQELSKLREAVKQFDGVDPEKARAAMEKMQQIEEQKLIEAGQIDQLLAQRTEAMRRDYDGKIDAMTKALEDAKASSTSYQSKLEEVVIDNALQMAVSEAGVVRKGAMRDVISRGRDVWRLSEDGNPQPLNKEGKVMYGKDADRPMTMTEWAQGLLKDAPYLFEGTAGGGAGGSSNESVPEGSISRSDSDAINQNIEAIAAGKVNLV